MDKAAIFSFMACERYAVVSSVSDDGSPQSALVGIAVTPELHIIFDTMKASRKYPNLIRRPHCAIAVGAGGSAGEQTVQMEGTAEELVGDDGRGYLDAYFEAWPDGRARLAWPGLTHFVVRPRWIRYSDFSRVPPLIEEFMMSG